MKIIQLGEQLRQPGATCTAVYLAGMWFVIDAGVGWDKSNGNNLTYLPNFDFLRDKQVQFLGLTHAHSDHMLAGPLFASKHHKMQVFASLPAKSIGRISSNDSLNNWYRDKKLNGTSPIYTKYAAENFFNRIQTASRPGWFPTKWPGWKIGLYPSGHTRGAMMILIVSPERNLLVTGDCCSQDQPLVKGVLLPPDDFLGDFLEDAEKKGGLVVISEATNGGRVIPSPQSEVLRMISLIEEAELRGGPVLLTALAEGRGTNVALNLVERWPVHLDGGVRNFWDFYQQAHAYWSDQDQPSPMIFKALEEAKRILFFNDRNREMQNEHRRRADFGEDCCATGERFFSPVVSSANLDNNGISVTHARSIMPNADGLIAATSHIFRETPMEKMLSAGGTGSLIKLGGEHVPLNACVAAFDFTAHDGGDKLAERIHLLGAKDAVLHHGSDENLLALERRLINLPSAPRVHRARHMEMIEL